MWKVRHEGSPQHLEMTAEQLTQSLADGQWEATDEVVGPGESQWVAIENHPQLEEIAADLEPPPAPHYDDETRLDMTALIDVCLVLLVFFILTTAVAALSTRVEAPGIEEKDSKSKIKLVTQKQIEEQMILVKATMEGGKPVVRIEDEVVPLGRLSAVMQRYVREKKNRSYVLLQQEDMVPHDVEVQVIAAAKTVGMDGVQLLVPPRAADKK